MQDDFLDSWRWPVQAAQPKPRKETRFKPPFNKSRTTTELPNLPIECVPHVELDLPKDKGERSAMTENVLNRQFQADAPNQK